VTRFLKYRAEVVGWAMGEMIRVVEAKETGRQVMRVLCEFCGERNDMTLVRMEADGVQTHKASLVLCCDETRDRINQGSTGNN